VNNGGCNVNAICTNTIGSFSCTCNPEYSGTGFSCSGNLQIINWFFSDYYFSKQKKKN